MIDFVRFEFRGQSKYQFEKRCEELQNLKDSQKEIFGMGILEQTFNRHTAEVNEYPLFMVVHNMKIKIHQNIARLEGSLHKLNNLRKEGVKHNFNSFTKLMILENLEFLEYLFPTISEAKITCLEFGLNVIPPFSSTTFIIERVHLHKELPPAVSVSSSRKVYKEFSHEEFDLKVYDKARHYRHLGSKGEILRFELRLRNRLLRKQNIRSIGDLKIPENYKILYSSYIERFNELKILDDYENFQISQNLKDKLDAYVSDRYWRRLRKNEHPQAIKRKQKQLEKIVQDYSIQKQKIIIKELLEIKFQELLES